MASLRPEAEAFGEVGRALRSEELQNGVERISIDTVGHV
jgi:hypothetical protein